LAAEALLRHSSCRYSVCRRVSSALTTPSSPLAAQFTRSPTTASIFLRRRWNGRRVRPVRPVRPELVTPVLQVVQRVVTRPLPGQAGLKADLRHGGAVTLIQPSL
jgi:hypothetical protein